MGNETGTKYYIVREEPCKRCGGSGQIPGSRLTSFWGGSPWTYCCSCDNGKAETKMTLIDGLRELEACRPGSVNRMLK